MIIFWDWRELTLDASSFFKFSDFILHNHWLKYISSTTFGSANDTSLFEQKIRAIVFISDDIAYFQKAIG